MTSVQNACVSLYRFPKIFFGKSKNLAGIIIKEIKIVKLPAMLGNFLNLIINGGEVHRVLPKFPRQSYH